MNIRTLVVLWFAALVACSPSTSNERSFLDDVEEDDDSANGSKENKKTIGTPDSTESESRPNAADAGTASGCQSARDVGSVKGDEDGAIVTAKGTCSEWLRVRVVEESSSAAPLRLAVTLVPDSDIDFDLFVYADTNTGACNVPTKQSTKSGTSVERVALAWGETDIQNGVDDDRTVWIEVKARDPDDCTGTKKTSSNWSLLVEGNRD